MTRDDVLAAEMEAAEDRVSRANHAAAEIEERMADARPTPALKAALARAETELAAAEAELAALRQRRAAASL